VGIRTPDVTGPGEVTLVNGTVTFSLTANRLVLGAVICDTVVGTALEEVGAYVSYQPPAKLSVAVPATVEVGAPFNVTVTALNADGTVDVGYNEPVGVRTPDVTGPGEVTLVNGTVTFSLTANRLVLGAVICDTTVGPALEEVGAYVSYEPPAPVISIEPQSQTVTAGQSATLTVGAAGSNTYQWNFHGAPIAGATASFYTVLSATTAEAGSYTVTVSNPNGSTASTPATLTVNATGPTAPVIQYQLVPYHVMVGSTVVLTFGLAPAGAAGASSASPRIANAAGSSKGSQRTAAPAGVTYQWFLNGLPILGATNANLVIAGFGATNAGSYTCLVTNSGGAVMTEAANVDVASTQDPGRLINLSARSTVGGGAEAMIAGFVIGGPGTAGYQDVLIRASGPALAPFGIASPLPDPSLALNAGTELLANDTGWGGNTFIASTAATVGAFAWTSAGSLDSALIEGLAAGPYTAEIVGASGDTGVALAEVYDATPAGAYTLSSPRLMNLSARAQVGSGSNVVIAGFVVGGSTAKTVLIRASGPALASFGVTGVLADPALQLFQSNSDGSTTLVQSATGWGGDPEIAATAATVGAFGWTNPSSLDSAILVTLAPGAYTAEVSGASGDSGIALVEVYDVP